MLDVPCVLLGIYPADGWLVGFNDPARGLSLSTPCYIPEHCVLGFTPHDPETGELRYGASEYGPGIIQLAENIWQNVHHRIAKVMKERQRIEAIEAAAARKKTEQDPRLARRNEDRMLRARKAKKHAESRRSRQPSLI